jgi:hypothetical protein
LVSARNCVDAALDDAQPNSSMYPDWSPMKRLPL